jgi:hypothetical protein
VATQKFTCPTVTGVVPAIIVAVSVTALPEATEVTALPAEVIARVLVVAAGAAHARGAPPPSTIHSPTVRKAAANRFEIGRGLSGKSNFFISGPAA